MAGQCLTSAFYQKFWQTIYNIQWCDFGTTYYGSGAYWNVTFKIWSSARPVCLLRNPDWLKYLEYVLCKKLSDPNYDPKGFIYIVGGVLYWQNCSWKNFRLKNGTWSKVKGESIPLQKLSNWTTIQLKKKPTFPNNHTFVLRGTDLTTLVNIQGDHINELLVAYIVQLWDRVNGGSLINLVEPENQDTALGGLQLDILHLSPFFVSAAEASFIFLKIETHQTPSTLSHASPIYIPVSSCFN